MKMHKHRLNNHRRNRKGLTPVIAIILLLMMTVAAQLFPLKRKKLAKRAPYRRSKKGLTPVIAIILLLMMTVAAAGAAFFWFVRIQSQMQGGTESYSEQLSEVISTKAYIAEVDVMNDEALKIIIRNIGNAEVPLSDISKITWILKDSDQNIVCNQYWNASATTETEDTYCQSGCGTNIPVKGMQEILINISNGSQECFMGGYANDSMFYLTINFAGETEAGASFEKDPAS